MSQNNVQLQNGNGQLAGLRNVLINPYMEIYQRGTGVVTTPSVAATAHYTGCDRWAIVPRASNQEVVTSVQLNVIPPSLGVPCNNAIYAENDATTDSFNLAQFIELPNSSSLGPFQPGTDWTLTVAFKSDEAFDLSATLTLSDGSDLSSGGSAPSHASSPITPNTWQLHTFRFTLPTNGSWAPGFKSVWCRINVGQDSTARHVYLGPCQLEPGPIATPFEHRPIGTELALCQRYYQNLSGCSYSFNWTAGSSSDVQVPYKVTMRDTPTVTVGSISGLIGNSPTFAGTTTHMARLSAGTSVENKRARFTITADAEL